jgi:RNA recognition motif-containing protein
LNVKVLKDGANRPFSFVQYTTAQEAGYALQQAQNASLDGRMIRVERARVNRTLYVTKEKGKLDEAVITPFPFRPHFSGIDGNVLVGRESTSRAFWTSGGNCNSRIMETNK